VRGRGLGRFEAAKWHIHFLGCKGIILPVVVRRTGGGVRMSVAEVRSIDTLGRYSQEAVVVLEVGKDGNLDRSESTGKWSILDVC